MNVWAQQDYSHLAARPAIATAFAAVFDDWARAHPETQLRVSVMPGLELHKAKLQLAAASGRLPDVASIDSFWLPLLKRDEARTARKIEFAARSLPATYVVFDQLYADYVSIMEFGCEARRARWRALARAGRAWRSRPAPAPRPTTRRSSPAP